MTKERCTVSRSFSGARLALLGGLVAIGCAPVYAEKSSRDIGALSVPATGSKSEPGRVEKTTDGRLVEVLESLVWPLARVRIVETSAYGDRRHPRGDDVRFHSGVDLDADEGTPVYAAADGMVARSERSGRYGNVVVIEHGGELRSLYAHHSRNLVREGDRVRRGQVIALAGHTGNATGDHLHFELRWRGGFVDPRSVLPPLEPSTGR